MAAVRVIAEAVEFGATDAITLLQAEDSDLILAAQAVSEVAREVRSEQYHELARHIVTTLAKAM